MSLSPEDVESLRSELKDAVKTDVRNELLQEFEDEGLIGSRKKFARRTFLRGMGVAGVAVVGGGVGSVAGAMGDKTGTLDVSSVTANTYRVAQNWYGGLDADKAELTAVLGIADAGARYSADDTLSFYRWDGNSWVTANPPASGGGGGLGLIEVSVGPGGDQDTIQDGHDALTDYPGGGSLVVLPGYDPVSAGETPPINWTSEGVLWGQGWGDNTPLDFTDPSFDSDVIFALGVEDTTVQGDTGFAMYNARIDGGGTGILFEEYTNNHFEFVQLKGQNNQNLDWQGSQYSGWTDFHACLFRDAGSSNGRPAVDMQVTPGDASSEGASNATTFRDSSVRAPSGAGVRLNGFNTQFLGGTVEGCQGPGIQITGLDAGNGDFGDYKIEGVYFEDNGNGGGVGDYDDTDIYVSDLGVQGMTIRDTFKASSGASYYHIVLDRIPFGSGGKDVANVTIENVRSTKNGRDHPDGFARVEVNNACKWIKLKYDTAHAPTSVSSSAQYVLYGPNQMGKNAGNPSTGGGEWGALAASDVPEGTEVLDTVGGGTWVFMDGAWNAS